VNIKIFLLLLKRNFVIDEIRKILININQKEVLRNEKNIVFIIAILSIVVLLTGCAPAPTAPPTNPQPASASLTVLSSDYYCYGYV